MTLARAGGRTRRIKVHDDPAAALSAYPRPLRQLAVTGLEHDQPTLLITNNGAAPARKIIESYARRMNIEQLLAEAIQSVGLDALAGAVPLNVDLYVVLCVLAHTTCAALRRRLPGYHTATPTPSSAVPQHRRDHHYQRRPDHRPDRPAHLLTRPPPGHPPRNHHRPLVGQPDTALRIRLTHGLGDNSRILMPEHQHLSRRHRRVQPADNRAGQPTTEHFERYRFRAER